MKVLDLRCGHDHRFEGWFASEEDYRSQTERGLVDCPLCSDREITRLPSAPRLNMLRTGSIDVPVVESTPPAAPSPGRMSAADFQAGWLHAVRHVLAHTEDVGSRFAEEARRIHHGETEERAIRGQATREDAEALRDEGIEVVSMPMPDALNGTLQ